MNEMLDLYRNEIDSINLQILKLLSLRGELSKKIGHEKNKQKKAIYDPKREKEMIVNLLEHNNGPFDNNSIERVFKEIFKISTNLQQPKNINHLYVSRELKKENTIVEFENDVIIGGENKTFIFGPCSVESQSQIDLVANNLHSKGEKFIRGGAFKPRSSPYDFQGLGEEGLKMLKNVKDKYNLNVISEIVTPTDLEIADKYLDIIQIGSRNMQNFELLKEAGKMNKPILLKRGLCATIEEFIYAAEYIASKGNGNIILCERGIRTYENSTRNTLDISAVPILKKATHLPIIVDITHSTGRKDIMIPIAKSALSAGADGIMAEVHPEPLIALSDSSQQMDLKEFDYFYNNISDFKNMY